MGSESTARRRSSESRLVFTFLGVIVWISTGFLVGLVAGVVSEEPELVVGHVTGQTTEIDWGELTRPEDLDSIAGTPMSPDVAAAPADERPELALIAAPERVSKKRKPSPMVGGLPMAGVSTQAAKGPRYSIQVGAFAKRDAAQEVAETLRGKGYAVQVLTAQDDGRWRVRVGPVTARDRAEGLARRLKTDEGLPTWVLRERES